MKQNGIKRNCKATEGDHSDVKIKLRGTESNEKKTKYEGTPICKDVTIPQENFTQI